ncbi:MAG TPA: hypothetical protein VFQ35_24080 [Polyangiaceae bacterium]|nr:hypothetical protein [Polyangiaceae bacterium]
MAALACADMDTIAALNVNVSKKAPQLTKIHVSIRQGGKEVAKDYDMLPTRTEGEGDAKMTFTAENFFERIKLDGFSDGKAMADVEAFAATGSFDHPPAVDFDVRENGATAVYVKIMTPEERAAASAGGAGGGGAGGNGGASAGNGGAAAAGGGAGGAANGGNGGAAAGNGGVGG